ncbi:hypothetical protein [Streptomyces aureus]
MTEPAVFELRSVIACLVCLRQIRHPAGDNASPAQRGRRHPQ